MPKKFLNLGCGRDYKTKKRELRLLVIQQNPDIGGAEVFMENLLSEFKRLKKTKDKIFVYTDSLRFNRKLEKMGIKTGIIPFTLDIIGNFRGLVKTILLLPGAIFWYTRLIWHLRMKINLILMSGFSEKLLVTIIASIFNLPVVWIEYGPLASVFRKNFYLPKIFYRLTNNLPRLILVPSKNTKLSLIKDAKVSLAKIRLIPLGVPFKKGRKKIKGKNKKIVGCLSRLAKEKGQEYLIRAAPLVLDKFSNVEFWIIGKGPDAERLKKISKKLNIERKVKFFGFVKDKMQVLSQIDIFVFPTVWGMEGFGLVTAEAMMAGIPVVATKTGPNPELVDDGKTGFLVEPASYQELSKAIIKLLENPKKALKFGREGKKKAINFFDLKKVSLEISEELERILKIRGRNGY